MEKYDNIIKIEEIKNLEEDQNFKQAAMIIDTMNINEIKATTDLTTIAFVLSENQRYDEALEVLERVYDKGKNRRIIYQLLSVAIKSSNLNLARRYYREYVYLAPEDQTKYIFQYLIAKLENRSIREQMIPLKRLKEKEYIEEWAYELATLYHRADMKEDCIAECNDIITWFGTGRYVDRAKLLKGYYEGSIDLFNLLEEKEKEQQLLVEESQEAEKIEELEENEASKETKEENLLAKYFQETKIDYRLIFGDFLTNKNLKDQIFKALAYIDENNITYFNLSIATKDKDMEKATSFSKAMLKLLYQLGHISNKRVGITEGEICNNIDNKRVASALRDCSLIIDRASRLDNETIDEIIKLILDNDQNIIIVLQDNEDEINQLLIKYPKLKQYFSIHIKL